MSQTRVNGARETSPQLISVDGGPLEVSRYAGARSDRPALVLLHEGLGCVHMWGDFPAALSERTGAEVLVYSRHGYGGSGDALRPRGSDFMHREASDVLPELLASAKLDRPFVLVGHSDGGSIAALYAGMPGVRSEQLAGAVFLAAHVFNEPLCIEGIRAASVAYADCPPDQGLKKALARFHGERTDSVFAAWRDIWLDPAFAHWNIETYLPSIECPVLVVQGVDDPYGSSHQVSTIRDNVSGPVTAVFFEDCGHSAHRDQTEQTIKHIERFLDAL